MSKPIPISDNSLDNIFKEIVEEIYTEGAPEDFYRFAKWGFMVGAGLIASTVIAASSTKETFAETVLSAKDVAKMLQRFKDEAIAYSERLSREATERN